MPSVWIESRKSGRGRVYVVRWQTVIGGVRHQGAKTCGPFKSYAEKLKAHKLEELFAGHVGVERERSDAGWRDFVESYLDHCQKHKSPRTVRNFDTRAMQIASERFGGREPATITSQDVAAWETELLTRFNPTTTRMWLRCLRTALRWGKTQGFVRTVPAFHMPRVEPVGRVLTDHEVGLLVKNLSEAARPAVIFDLYTGLRASELQGLRWERIREVVEDVNGKLETHLEAEIGGVGGPKTKTGKSRVVAIHPVAEKAMGIPKKSGLVFSRVRDLSHRIQDAAVKSGLGRVRLHDLRHTWATKYMMETGDLFGLMAAGGWSDMGSVKVYQHLTKRRAQSAKIVEYPVSIP